MTEYCEACSKPATSHFCDGCMIDLEEHAYNLEKLVGDLQESVLNYKLLLYLLQEYDCLNLEHFFGERQDVWDMKEQAKETIKEWIEHCKERDKK